jgi:hypothetical protein
MSSSGDLSSVLNAVDLIVEEVKRLRSRGPHFRIIHRFRMPGSHCLPGEEIFAVFLVYRGREYQLPLSPAQLLVLDFLAKHSRVAQSAKQIELGIRMDDFYIRHGMNAKSRSLLVRRIPRSAVREHIKRIHLGLDLVFREANLLLDPFKVLTIERTVSNEVHYRLRASCQWTHLDLTSLDSEPVWM